MCKPFSCIVTKGKRVLTCEDYDIHEHEEIIKEHHLKDDKIVNRTWIRIQVYPKMLDDIQDYTSNVDNWIVEVDEWTTLTEWFTLNQEVYEDKCRKAAKKWQDKCVNSVGEYISKLSITFLCGKTERYNEYWRNGQLLSEKFFGVRKSDLFYKIPQILRT